MESLINESKANYFKFLSVTAFNIPIIILPFNRKANLSQTEKVNSIIRSLHYFKEKMMILVDQSSTHSLILKLREENIKNSGNFTK